MRMDADGCKRIQTDANNADTENDTETDTETENGTETAPGKGVRGENPLSVTERGSLYDKGRSERGYRGPCFSLPNLGKVQQQGQY